MLHSPRMPRVLSINVNPAGGVPKCPVDGVRLLVDGVEGDKQRNLKYHGGPDRAVCLYAIERIQSLQAEGHPIQPGDVGENLTLEGIDWDTLIPGTRLSIGDAVIEITSYTVPCNTIAGAFCDGKSKRISQALHPGWSRVYARVVTEGFVRTGDAVVVG